ncbi:MAG: protease modulator HflC, partial [Thermodesulfobacteriota bacterium]|nr:protease modulator HflC [Thermodesulfobacteriota bacterium]
YDQAYAKLDDTIDSIVKDFVSSTPLVELVRTTAEIRRVEGSNDGGNLKKDRIESAAGFIGREKITRAILKEAEKAMPDFGIELVDVRIKRINYVESVRKKVYERMISERKRKASLFRSEGEGKKAEILGQMDKELKKITSGAFKTAEEIKGKADAEATRIYGKAYNQDPEFYAFYKALQTYSKSSFENATVIMGTDSDYYAFLKDIKGR